jgi:Putative DNA-binding domain
MQWLDGGQAAMMAALDHGPDHLPGDLFTGTPDRVLAGMKVHANTISHARLVALEETYPRTQSLIGHEAFNTLSRRFLDQPGVAAQALASIGSGFDVFLRDAGERADAADLARFEWLWLQSYHAADAAPLRLADLAGLEAEALLEVGLMAHPAAIADRFAPLVHELIGAEVEGLVMAEAVLITRPDNAVLIAPATAMAADMLAIAHNPSTIGNLLAPSGEEEHDAAAAMPALVTLIEAGALIRVGIEVRGEM